MTACIVLINGTVLISYVVLYPFLCIAETVPHAYDGALLEVFHLYTNSVHMCKDIVHVYVHVYLSLHVQSCLQRW